MFPTPDENLTQLDPDQRDELHEEFLGLLQASYHSIYGCVATFVTNRADAEDVMQEVVIVLWRRFADYDRQRPFKQWANGVAANTARAFLRHESRRRRSIVLNDDLLKQLARVRNSCSELLELRQDRLKDCLKKLPTEERRLLLKCYQKDNKINDIAREESCSSNALYHRLARMRTRLFKCIDRRMGGET
ncbi:sigma-70 family RNA polymerase sigma factor [Calycomorphotria hydatis]|uniref:RNA polymerase sigma factor n=1 Tax=Calycomorphotria hydatis TaxID=2528027 RepID=A0A517TBN4_9PLAN|nr:sigma-70 family RNA polymerase sigma factor [Calycomorphotria hydatis]QDT65779.1 RNA polymerase sigma factor [Calycomorphotria hydatis]